MISIASRCIKKPLGENISSFWDHDLRLFGVHALDVEEFGKLPKKSFKASHFYAEVPERDIFSLPSLAKGSSEAIEQLSLLCRYALEYNTSHVVVWPGVIPYPGIPDFPSFRVGQQPTEEELATRKNLVTTVVENFCRSLHQVASSYPDISFCIPAARSFQEFPLLEEMEWIIDSLKKNKIYYWHMTSHTHFLSKAGYGEAEEWLSRYGNCLAGITLEDVVTDQKGFPPGSGEVNFAYLKNHLTAQAIQTLSFSPDIPFPLEQVYQQAKSLLK